MNSAVLLSQLSENITGGISIINVVKESTLTVNLILFFLIILSVACWAIIVYKFIQYRKAIIATEQFIKIFWNNLDYTDIFDKSHQTSLLLM